MGDQQVGRPFNHRAALLLFLFWKDRIERWDAYSSPAFYFLGCKRVYKSGFLEQIDVVSCKLVLARIKFYQTHDWDFLRGKQNRQYFYTIGYLDWTTSTPSPIVSTVICTWGNAVLSCFWEVQASVLSGWSVDIDCHFEGTGQWTWLKTKWRHCPKAVRLISAAPLTIQSYFHWLTAPLCAGYGLGHHETHLDWACADDPCTARGMFRGPGSAPGTGILQGWSVRLSGVVLGLQWYI